MLVRLQGAIGSLGAGAVAGCCGVYGSLGAGAAAGATAVCTWWCLQGATAVCTWKLGSLRLLPDVYARVRFGACVVVLAARCA